MSWLDIVPSSPRSVLLSLFSTREPELDQGECTVVLYLNVFLSKGFSCEGFSLKCVSIYLFIDHMSPEWDLSVRIVSHEHPSYL